jgi:hypothetical protein
MSCALMLGRYRHHAASLTKAAFLSARNDALANIAIILAGLVTAYLWCSAWQDLIVGLAIAAMNEDAARADWQAALQEHRAAGIWLVRGRRARGFCLRCWARRYAARDAPHLQCNPRRTFGIRLRSI